MIKIIVKRLSIAISLMNLFKLKDMYVLRDPCPTQKLTPQGSNDFDYKLIH